jgi:hypothetical protein
MDQLNGVPPEQEVADEALRSAIHAWHGYEPVSACQDKELPGAKPIESSTFDGGDVIVPTEPMGADQAASLNRLISSWPDTSPANLARDKDIYADAIAGLRQAMGRPSGGDNGPQTVAELAAFVGQAT